MTLQVAYLGASNLFGRVVTTFLRQFPSIQRLNIYGYNEPFGLSEEFSGSCELHQYMGKGELPIALENVDIVVIGDETDSSEPSRECILNIASKVFDYAFVTASVAPNAMVVVSAKPLNLMVPLMGHILQDLGCFDGRKLLGVTSEEGLRANPLYAELIGVEEAVLPVVGGSSPQTRVPLFSHAKPNVKLKEEEKHKLINDIKSFDLIFPQEEIQAERAYATIKLLRSLIRGLENKDGPVTEMAMTKTSLVADTSYFSLPIQLGRAGVERAFGLPPLEGLEEELLEYAVINLNHDLTRAFDIFRGLKPSIEGITSQSGNRRKENLKMDTCKPDNSNEENKINLTNGTLLRNIDEERRNNLIQITGPTLEKDEVKINTLRNKVSTLNNDPVTKTTIHNSSKDIMDSTYDKESIKSIIAANTNNPNSNVINEIYGSIIHEGNEKDRKSNPKAIPVKNTEETINQLKNELILLNTKKEHICNSVTDNYIETSDNGDSFQNSFTNVICPNQPSSESNVKSSGVNIDTLNQTEYGHYHFNVSGLFLNSKKELDKKINNTAIENDNNNNALGVSMSVNHSLDSKRLDDLANEIEKYTIDESKDRLHGSSEFENNKEKLEGAKNCPAQSVEESLTKKIGENTYIDISENTLNQNLTVKQSNSQSKTRNLMESNVFQTSHTYSGSGENKKLNNQVHTRKENVAYLDSKADKKLKNNENNNDENIKECLRSQEIGVNSKNNHKLNSPEKNVNGVICKEFSLRDDEGLNWKVLQESSGFAIPQKDSIEYSDKLNVTKISNPKLSTGEESNINSMIKNVCSDVNEVITNQVGNVQKVMGLIKNKFEFAGSRIDKANNQENVKDLKVSKRKEKVLLKSIKNKVENIFESQKTYQSSTNVLYNGIIKKTKKHLQGHLEKNISKGKNFPSVIKNSTKIVNMICKKENKMPEEIRLNQTQSNKKLPSQHNKTNHALNEKKENYYFKNLKFVDSKSINKKHIKVKSSLAKEKIQNNLPVTKNRYKIEKFKNREVEQKKKVKPIQTRIKLLPNICKNTSSENKKQKINSNYFSYNKSIIEDGEHITKGSEIIGKINSQTEIKHNKTKNGNIEINNEVILRNSESVSNKPFQNLLEEQMLPIRKELSNLNSTEVQSEKNKYNNSLGFGEDLKVNLTETNLKLSSSNKCEYDKSVITEEMVKEISDNDQDSTQIVENNLTNKRIQHIDLSATKNYNLQGKIISSGQAEDSSNSMKVEKNIPTKINSKIVIQPKPQFSTKIMNITCSKEDSKNISNEIRNKNISEHELISIDNKLSNVSGFMKKQIELNKVEIKENNNCMEVKYDSNSKKVNQALTNIKFSSSLPQKYIISKDFNILPKKPCKNQNTEETILNRNLEGRNTIGNKPNESNYQINKVNEIEDKSKISPLLPSRNKAELDQISSLNSDITYLKQLKLNTSKNKYNISDIAKIEEKNINDQQVKCSKSLPNLKNKGEKYELCTSSSVKNSITSDAITREVDNKLNPKIPLNKLTNSESLKTKYNASNEAKDESGEDKGSVKAVERNIIDIENPLTGVHKDEKKKVDKLGEYMSKSLNSNTNTIVKSDKFIKRYTLLKKGEVSPMIKEDLNVDKCKATLFKHNQNKSITKGSSSIVHQENKILENIKYEPFKPEESCFIFDKVQNKSITAKRLEKIIGIRGSHNFSKNEAEHQIKKNELNNKGLTDNRFEKEARKKLSMSKLINGRKNKSKSHIIQHLNQHPTKKKSKHNKKDTYKSKTKENFKLFSKECQILKHVAQNVIPVENNKHLKPIIPKEKKNLTTKTKETGNNNENTINLTSRPLLEDIKSELDNNKLVPKETNNPLGLNLIKLATNETMGDKHNGQVIIAQTTSKTNNVETVNQQAPPVLGMKVLNSVTTDNSNISKIKFQAPKCESSCTIQNEVNSREVKSIKLKSDNSEENQTNINISPKSNIEIASIKLGKINTTKKENIYNNPTNQTQHTSILNVKDKPRLETKLNIVKKKVILKCSQASLNLTEEKKITLNNNNKLLSDKISKQIKKGPHHSFDLGKTKIQPTEKGLIQINKNINLTKSLLNTSQAKKLPNQTLPKSNHLQWSTKSLKSSQGIGMSGSKGENIKEIAYIRIDRNPFTAGKIKMNTHLFKEYMNSKGGYQKDNSKDSLMTATKRGNYITQNLLQEINNKTEVSKNQMIQNDKKLTITDKYKYFKKEKEPTVKNAIKIYINENENRSSRLLNKNAVHNKKNKNDMIRKSTLSSQYTNAHNIKMQNLFRNEVEKQASIENSAKPYSHFKMVNGEKKLKNLHNFSARNFLELNQVRIKTPYTVEKEPIKKIHLLKAFRGDDEARQAISITAKLENNAKQEKNSMFKSERELLKPKKNFYNKPQNKFLKEDKLFKKDPKLKTFNDVLPPLGSVLPECPKPISVHKLKNINASLSKDAGMKHFRSHLKRLFNMFQSVISNETKLKDG